ncbi:lipid A deacylase LpxR family protein [Flavobacterium sp.]|uniref:lipid A deacylase LpxR family protein n=1 Tax=Flavobacterium sp. TaxID=239 RepID=UPI002869F6D7|nr:lipid A deacylase LpxR family protein [Flavobacterium sp.]
MKQHAIYLLFLIAFPLCLFAQKIDNTASFRDLKTERYFRFNYDNDYFASKDQDYTQGYNFELVSPAMRHNPINKLFQKSKKRESQYGISIEHIGFTAFNIGSPEIQYGDRPFAAAIMLKSFAIATDTIHKSRWVSSLNIGLIGPGAFGKEMQVAIHEATGNTIPQGWQHQIRNDAVLNYEVGYEKKLLRYNNLFSLQTNTTLRLGTLFTNASVGINTTFGIINEPFASLKTKKKLALYGYVQPMLNIIGYDATLQGGLFNRKSPYTIPDSQIERFTAQVNYGIVLQTCTLFLEYSRVMITREFEKGSSSKWGGIKIGFRF